MARENMDGAKWARIKVQSINKNLEHANQMAVSFSYELKANIETSFAFCYPWGYAYNQ